MPKPQETLQLLRSRSMSSVLQDEIEQRILSGALQPGERVNENALATELGVSRGPIREACRGLVESGLLTIIVNRGVFVREVSRKDAIDVYNVRASLMRLAGETLAERISADQLAVLRDLVERMDTAEADNDFDSFYALNRDFHTRIVDYADNGRLRSLSDGLVKELHLYRHRSILQGGGLHVSNREHKKILSALEAGDPARAGAALEDHIKAGMQRFLAATAQDTPNTE
jgi:DNA-binding GntR family transcriptional regulator